ncbi:MAG: formate transporter FocA [Pyrinomonadaceae bacterium]|nr:formate transporter FocA [Pyrinomonadaceae bacterium]
MAQRAEGIGEAKAKMEIGKLLALSVLAGAFIAFGAVLATLVTTDSGSSIPVGISRLLGGIVFSVGLILVVVGGAELFTGNNLIVMSWASRKTSTAAVLRNWALVFVGNFIGSISIAVFIFLSGHLNGIGGKIGENALQIATRKLSLGFVEAVVLGILCNVLVCLAVWLSFSARSTTDKILSIVPPITTFVACGFEHSIANMYFIPVALLLKTGAGEEFWSRIGSAPADFPDLTWGAFFVDNLLPVTIGNIIGGAVLVGAVYWFVYLRSSREKGA